MLWISFNNPSSILSASQAGCYSSVDASRPELRYVEPDSSGCPWPELFETIEEYVLKFQVPGRRKDEFDIRYSAGHLIVSSRNSAFEQTDVQNCQDKRITGDFSCTFKLPEMVESHLIRPELREGILEVHLPKHKSGRYCRIAVR